MEPLFAVPKTMRVPGGLGQLIILFGIGLFNDSAVIDVLSPTATPVYFLTAES